MATVSPVTLSTVDAAWAVAREVHGGQTYSGHPYVDYHVRHIADAVARVHPGDTGLLVVAILHDTVEDDRVLVHDAAIAGIREAFGDRVADAVDALTRRPREPYNVYIRRLMTNEDARLVKVQDLLENIAHAQSPACPSDKRQNWRRYVYALEMILGEA